MGTKEYTFEASIVAGKKIIKGILKLSIDRFVFIDSSNNIRHEKKIDWRDVKCITGKINVPVFLFISSPKEYIKFKTEKNVSLQYVIDKNDINKILCILDRFKVELIQKENEKKLQEAEEQARIEEEQKAKEEATRKQQEVEEQKRLEAERKINNNENNSTCQKENEFCSYSRHVQCAEDVLCYDENNPIVIDLMDVVRKYHYDLDTETDGVLLFKFLSGLISSDDPGEFLDTNSDTFAEIEVLMNFANVSSVTIRKFENIVNLLGEYEIVDTEYISDILDQIFSEINNVYHSDIRAYKKNDYESKKYIEHEWMDVKREIREEENKYRKEKYAKALEYIKNQKYPFKKESLKKATGVPDGIIRNVFKNETKIVNYYREYIWYYNLDISQQEERALLMAVKQIVDDYEIHHIQEIYESLLTQFSSFFNRIMVTTPYRLLGLLRVIPGGNDIYRIEQPYIARVGVQITTTQERLQDFIRYKEKVSVSTILQYARDNYMHVQSIIGLLNSLNGTHIFLNKYEMIRTSKVFISSEQEKQIIMVFEDELEKHNGLMAICQMEHAHELPVIDYEWNEWLLYSIMQKGKRYPKVFLSSNTFSEAIPMVSNRYQYSDAEVEEIAKECKNRELKVADNMNNIDEILEDMIDDFIEDIEF